MNVEAAVEIQKSANGGERKFSYNPRFLKFIEQFAAIGEDGKIFPKTCRNCGRTYRSFHEYMKATSPLKQSMEDYQPLLNAPYTVQYRNCSCGSTLALAFTMENFPMISEFWAALHEEALETGKPLSEVLTMFREQCNHYMGIVETTAEDPRLPVDESGVPD